MKRFFSLIPADYRFIIQFSRPYSQDILLFVFTSGLTTLLDGISIGLLIPLFGSLQQISEVKQLPPFIQWVIALFNQFSMQEQLIYVTFLIVIAVLLKNGCMALSFYSGFKVGCHVAADIQQEAIKMLLTVGLPYYSTQQSGKIVDKALYQTEIVKMLIMSFAYLMIHLIILWGLFALLLILSWQFTLLTLFFVGLLIVIIVLYSRWVKQLGDFQAQNQQGLSGALFEMVGGIAVIKSFAKEVDQFAKLKDRIDRYQASYYKTNLISSLAQNLTEALGVLIIGGIFLLMITTSSRSSVLLVQYVPFFYVIVRMVPHLKIINQERTHIQGQLPALKLVMDLLDPSDKPMMIDGEKCFETLKDCIRLESVTFGYQPDKPKALTNVSFIIPQGKTTALVGESGAGKSTLISLLFRFYDPERGTIWLDDYPLTAYQLKSYRQKIGIVSQDTFIFNDTAKANIAFGSSKVVSDDSVIDAAKKAYAHEFIQDLPNGYDTILGDRGVTLSGGQRQRIAIARAVLENPDILILDEATSALDNQTEKQVHEALTELRKDRTVIIVAHRLSTIQNADQIIVLKAGRLVEMGQKSDLLKQKGEYYRLTSAS